MAILAATLMAVTLLVMPWTFDRYLLPKQAVLHLCAFGSLLTWLLTERAVGIRPALLADAGCMIAGLTIATMHARVQATAVMGAAVWIDWACIMIAFCGVVTHKRRRDALAFTIALLCAFEALLCIGQLFLPVCMHTGPLRRLDACGTFGNPEMVAGFLGTGLILALYERGFARPMIRRAIIVTVGAGIIACRSRGSWLALALTIGVIMALQTQTSRRKGAILAIAAIMAVVTAFGLLAARFELLPPALLSLHTLKGRCLIWLAGINLARDSCGMGIGMDQVRYHFFQALHDLFAAGRMAQFHDNAAMVYRLHNEYLDLLVEGGVAMAAALALFLVVLTRRFAASHNRADLMPFAGMIVFILLFSFVSFPLHVTPALLVFGFAASAILVDGPHAGLRYILSRRIKLLATAVLLVWFMSTGIIYARALSANVRQHQARKAVAAGDYTRARIAAEKGLGIAPDDCDLLLTQARIRYRFFELDSALSDLRRLAEIGPSVDGLKLLGLTLEGLKRYDDARTVYRRLATAFPTQVTPWYRQGLILLKQGQTAQARQCLSAALDREAKSPKARREHMLSRLLLGRMEK
jgi:tetratricopeptide (TPR) repeat protein